MCEEVWCGALCARRVPSYIVAVAVGVFFCSRRLQQHTQRTMHRTRMQQPPTAAAMIAMNIVMPMPAIMPATSR